MEGKCTWGAPATLWDNYFKNFRDYVNNLDK